MVIFDGLLEPFSLLDLLVVLEKFFRLLPCGIENRQIADYVSNPKFSDTGLSRAEYLPLPTELKVLLRDPESIACLFHYSEAFFGDRRLFVAGQQYTE